MPQVVVYTGRGKKRDRKMLTHYTREFYGLQGLRAWQGNQDLELPWIPWQPPSSWASCLFRVASSFQYLQVPQISLLSSLPCILTLLRSCFSRKHQEVKVHMCLFSIQVVGTAVNSATDSTFSSASSLPCTSQKCSKLFHRCLTFISNTGK